MTKPERLSGRDAMLLSCDHENRYYLNRMRQAVQVEQRDHDARKLLLGTDEGDGQVFLTIKDAFRAVVMAMTGSGKTFLIRRILDVWVLSVSKRTGLHNCAFILDMKDEYKSSRKPVQAKFRDGLPDDEHPTGHDMFVCRPTFFRTVEPDLPKGNMWVSIELKDLDFSDIQMLIGFDTLTDKQQKEFRTVWATVEGSGDITVDNIMQVCLEKQFNKLQDNIQFLKTSHLFDSDHVVSPVEMLQLAPVLILNFADSDSLDISDISVDQIFFNVWYKKIKAARKKALIGQLLMVIDEARLLVPAKGNPLSKKIILKSIKEGRMSGISYIFGIQDRSDVPEKEVLTQCQHWFLPNNMKEEDFREIIRWHQLFPGRMLGIGNYEYQDILRNLKKPYRWFYIDTAKVEDKGTHLKFYPPVSNHMEMIE